MAEAIVYVDIPKAAFFVKEKKKVLEASFVLNLNYCFM